MGLTDKSILEKNVSKSQYMDKNHECYRVKKPESSRPGKFSRKKKTWRRFPLAATPFSAILGLIVDIIYLLK